MKKSLSRILSLALVLAMLVSVVPFAFAEGEDSASVNVTATQTTAKLDDTIYLNAELNGAPEGAVRGNTTWSNGSSYTVTADDVEAGSVTLSGSVEISYTYQVQKTDENGDPVYKEDGEPDMKTITGTAKSNYEIKITIVSETEVAGVTVTPSSATIAVGGSVTLEAAVEPDNATNQNVTWKSSDPSVATVSTNGVVTGKKAGTTTITVTTEDGEKTASATIEVVDVAINCDNDDVAVGYTVTLAPSLSNSSKVENITYTYATKSSNISLGNTTGSSVAVKGKSEGAATVTITATYYLDGEKKTTSKDVTVYVYDDHTAEFTVKSGVTAFDFDDDNVFTAIKYDGTSLSKVAQSIGDIVTTTGANEITVTVRSSTTATKVGTMSCSGVSGTDLSKANSSMLNISNIKFTLNGKSGTQYLDYTLKSKDGLTVSTGTIAITTGGSSGDIVYETNYSTAVTFDEDDFEDFWNDSYASSSNTLKYVVFGVSNSIPSYGELYTTTAKNKSVTSSMKFQPNYSSSSSYYDLDTVTYVPSTKYTSAYTVEIPFTAYGGSGTSSSTSLSGVVVIDLNSGSTGIYSTGVIFGKGTNSVADQIIDDYKTATKTDLAYVIFDLPDVEDGRLYYDYTTILDTDYVEKKDEFYVDPGKNDLDLEAVAFVPAAGRTGKVTIYYTGYDKNGKNAYEGKITLNVVAKTSSSYFTDVTTSSYSWAADSIDFLYVQEVVQGSGKKYSPASSITRGDFMIMLYRAFLEGKYGNYNVTSNFADVTKGTDSYSKETYQAVGVAKYLGIAQGDGTNFKPKTSITREEAMTLIYRTLDVMDLELEYSTRTSTSSFNDYSSVSSYAKTSISYLIQHGIVIGSNGKISPKSNITRAEMAVILHRVLTY